MRREIRIGHREIKRRSNTSLYFRHLKRDETEWQCEIENKQGMFFLIYHTIYKSDIICVRRCYRVGDVDLLSNHCGVIDYVGILVTFLDFNVFIPWPSGRCIFLKYHIFQFRD